MKTANSHSYKCFFSGVSDGRDDRIEGWIPADMTADEVENHVRAMLGDMASDQYYEGYIAGAFDIDDD